MPRYIGENEIYKLLEPHGVAKIHCSQIDELQRADVVPKSEVEELKDWVEAYKNTIESMEKIDDELRTEVADLQDALKCEKETNSHLCEQYMKAKADVAREIFEEVEGIFKKRIDFYTAIKNKAVLFAVEKYAETMIANCNIYLQDIAELKKKYTEGEPE